MGAFVASYASDELLRRGGELRVQQLGQRVSGLLQGKRQPRWILQYGRGGAQSRQATELPRAVVVGAVYGSVGKGEPGPARLAGLLVERLQHRRGGVQEYPRACCRAVGDGKARASKFRRKSGDIIPNCA